MTEERTQRRLAAILAADVVGYRRCLMGEDETGTLAALKQLRKTWSILVTFENIPRTHRSQARWRPGDVCQFRVLGFARSWR